MGAWNSRRRTPSASDLANWWKTFTDASVWLSGNLPIFQRQTRNAGEFVGVVTDENQVVRQGDGRDLVVVLANWTATGFEVEADSGVNTGRGVIEREGSEPRYERIDLGQFRGRVAAPE